VAARAVYSPMVRETLLSWLPFYEQRRFESGAAARSVICNPCNERRKEMSLPSLIQPNYTTLNLTKPNIAASIPEEMSIVKN